MSKKGWGSVILAALILGSCNLNSQDDTSTTTQASAPTTTTTRAPSTYTPRWTGTVTPAPQPEKPQGETITISRVVDGDTFELTDGRTVRVLGIDSCEMNTPGGKWAKEHAESTLNNSFNQPLTLVAEPGAPDKDRYGRLLRYVKMGGYSDGYDFGIEMVKWDHTGIYNPENNDASEEYIRQLYEHDRDLAQAPAPAGRDCSRGDYWGVGDHGGRVDVDVDDDDDGDDRESRFCRKRWWC